MIVLIMIGVQPIESLIEQLHRDVGVVALLREVVLDDVAPAVGVGLMDDEHPVEPARPDERLVEHLGSVRRADDEDQRLVLRRSADEAEPAQDLVPPAVLDELAERVHLVEQRVEALLPPPMIIPPIDHPARLRCRAIHADRVDLVHEQDAGAALAGLRVLAREPARVAEQLHDHQLGHAPEHAAERARVDVDERQVGLRRDDAARNVLPVPGRPDSSMPLRHLAAALLEFLDAPQDADRGLGVLEQVRLAAVVLEGHARSAGRRA